MNEDDVRFRDLIEENRAPPWRFALSLTRSRCDAADLVSGFAGNHSITYGGLLISIVGGELK
jgi:hypothetical protein